MHATHTFDATIHVAVGATDSSSSSSVETTDSGAASGDGLTAGGVGIRPPSHRKTVSPYRDPDRLFPTESAPHGAERVVAADVRRVIATCVTSPTPSPAARPRWLLETARAQVAASRDAKDRPGPVRFAVVAEVTGAVNKYLYNFAPGLGAVFAGHDVRASLAEDLDGVAATRAAASHNDVDPHLAWWLPAGLLLDEIRVGPHWDDVVDRWMWRKLLTDVAVGTALAARRGHAFLGVRVLPLNNPASALLVTARADGHLTARPARTLDLTARPAGITVLWPRSTPASSVTASNPGKHAYPSDPTRPAHATTSGPNATGDVTPAAAARTGATA